MSNSAAISSKVNQRFTATPINFNALCVPTIMRSQFGGDFWFWPLRALCGANSRVKIVSWHQTKVLLDSYKLLSGQCFIFFEGENEFVEYSVKPFLYNEIAVE